MSQHLEESEVICLKSSMDMFKSRLHPTNLLEEIGGVGVMKKVFSTLYERIEVDEFLAHLLK